MKQLLLIILMHIMTLSLYASDKRPSNDKIVKWLNANISLLDGCSFYNWDGECSEKNRFTSVSSSSDKCIISIEYEQHIPSHKKTYESSFILDFNKFNHIKVSEYREESDEEIYGYGIVKPDKKHYGSTLRVGTNVKKSTFERFVKAFNDIGKNCDKSGVVDLY